MEKNLDIPVLENEEMWASRVIDSKGAYKVVYYPTAREPLVENKWFETLHDATTFCLTKGHGDVIEVKWYPSNGSNGYQVRQ